MMPLAAMITFTMLPLPKQLATPPQSRDTSLAASRCLSLAAAISHDVLVPVYARVVPLAVAFV